jgi:hypothetical protein
LSNSIKQSFYDYLLGRIKYIFSYRKFLSQELSGKVSRKKFNANSAHFYGYPENHNYSFYKDKLIPSFKLFERFEQISKLYPERFESILDISASRGFYVINASLMDSVKTAVGIDIDEKSIRECNAIKMFVGADKASFSVSTLEDFHRDSLNSHTQYDVVIFTGSYHYFYWGSGQSSHAYMSHDKILKMLSDITRDRVIFSGRMEVSDLAEHPQSIAIHHPEKALYTTDEFMRCASKYFKISHHGFLGKSPLFLLEKHENLMS